MLGFGVPYFNTFFWTCSLKGTIMEKKVYTFFSPWLLQSPVLGTREFRVSGFRDRIAVEMSGTGL